MRAADEETLRRVLELLGHTASELKPAVGALGLLVDQMSLIGEGKPFHKLDRKTQLTLVDHWAHRAPTKTPIGLFSAFLKLVHFDRPDVYGALGGKLNTVASMETPRWLSQIVAADALEDDELECEVVVIGTGAQAAPRLEKNWPNKVWPYFSWKRARTFDGTILLAPRLRRIEISIATLFRSVMHPWFISWKKW